MADSTHYVIVIYFAVVNLKTDPVSFHLSDPQAVKMTRAVDVGMNVSFTVSHLNGTYLPDYTSYRIDIFLAETNTGLPFIYVQNDTFENHLYIGEMVFGLDPGASVSKTLTIQAHMTADVCAVVQFLCVSVTGGASVNTTYFDTDSNDDSTCTPFTIADCKPGKADDFIYSLIGYNHALMLQESSINCVYH